jgi:hypothetical protein
MAATPAREAKTLSSKTQRDIEIGTLADVA